MKRNSTSGSEDASGLPRALDSDQYTASRYRVVRRVAPGLTHELRGPLNALNLNVELLKMTAEAVDEKGVEKRKRYVTVVAGELERFHGLFERFVEQILGGESEEPERIDLARLVDEVHEMVSVQVRKEGVRLTVDIEDESVFVRANRSRLRQAVLIAVVSALDALTASEETTSGEASPEDMTLALRLAVAGGRARLTIIDSSPVAARSEGAVAGGESLELARTLTESQGAGWSFEAADGGGSKVTMEMPLSEDGT